MNISLVNMSKVVFNGTEVDKVKFNGAQVWKRNKAVDWHEVQSSIRAGFGSQLYPVGYEFTVNHSITGGRGMVFRVVAHDRHTPADESLTHSMTLESKYLYSNSSGNAINFSFDAPEALYYAENGLAAGTYNFTLPAGYDTAYGGGKTLSFTLTQPVPAGGVIMFPWSYNSQSTDIKISTYAGNADETAIESVAVTESTDGASLGTADGKSANMNRIERVRYGSNNYAQSAIRRWLNSDAAAGSVWVPTNIFDRQHYWIKTYAGFMRGLDSSFSAVVQPAAIPCRTNSVFETNSLDGTEFTTNQVYTLHDKFFLLSRPEIYGTWDSSSYKDGELLEFYEGKTDAERIKYTAAGSPYYCWLRSSYLGAYNLRRVNNSGTIGVGNASDSNISFAPACIIA